MAQIQPEEGVSDPEADRERSLGRRGSQLLRESVRRSTLSGTHFLRLFLLTPAVIWAVYPVRFFDLHPSMFAAPVPTHETIAGVELMLMYLPLALTAMLLAHVLEAGHRAKLPALSITVRKQPRCTMQLNAKRARTWTSLDLLEAATTGGLLAAGTWDQLEVYGSHGWVRAVFLLLAFFGPFLLGLLFKRMLQAVSYVQDDRMAAWVGTRAVPLLVKAIGLQVVITSMQHIAILAYPYVVSTTALSTMHATGNNSLVRCDDEAAFWASFKLPFTFQSGRDPLDCDDRLCGYTDWVSLCQARRTAGLAWSTSWLAIVLPVCELCFLIVFLGLEGDGRFALRSTGELDLARLRAPHIILVLALVGVALLVCLIHLARFIVQAPLLMIATTPGFDADAQFTCGVGTICDATLLLPMYCAIVAVLLLPFDTLQRFVKTRRKASPSFLLSYKQKDGNDGAVQQLFDLLRERGSKAWLDKRAEDRSEKGMVAGVKSSDVFVAVLSPAYFASWFCCLEMHTALTEQKPILVVWNQTEHVVQSALKWIPEALHFLKDNELLPIQEDIQMALPCVARILDQSAKVEPTTVKEVPPIKAFQQATKGGGSDLQSVVSELKQAHARMQQEHARMQQELQHLRFRGTE